MVRTVVVVDFAEISCLDFGPDAHKGASQRILGRSEQHLVPNLGTIGRPGRTRERKEGGERVVITAGCGPQAGIHQLKKTSLFLLPPSFSNSKS